MQGSLALHNGVLYVGRHAKTAWVATYDLDGRPLDTSFAFRDEAAGRSAAGGIDVDADHRVWVADTAAGRVRAFTLFGQGVVDIGDPEGTGDADVLGTLGGPTDVLALGEDEALEIVVASGGSRRHALQVFRAHAGRVRSLRPMGDPRARFRGLVGIAGSGEWLFACESRAQQIQVFRDGEFHYTIRVPVGGGGAFEPVAAALLSDDRAVIATAGDASGLLLVDRTGRLKRVLAEGGRAAGQVEHPGDVVVAEGAHDRETRVVVIDHDGERVQVFTLEGRCYGAFSQLTGS